MRVLLLSLFLLPIIELLVLIEVGSEVGALVTIALVFLTALIGLSLIRQQGAMTMLQARSKLQEGQLPAKELVHTVMLGIAGVFLLFPGFISDVVGGLLLVPFVRNIMLSTIFLKLFSGVLSRKTTFSSRHFSNTDFTSQGQSREDIIEGEFVEENKDLIERK